MNDLERERERLRRKEILGNFDEIAERLALGESVDLNTFVPSADRKAKKNAAIVKTLDNKQKL